MEIFLDPNIAYLLLVAGFLLAAMAFATPGTGILEIGALGAFILVGWAVYNLPVNLWAVGLLIVGIFPLTALFKTRRSIFLVMSILALEIGSAFLFREDGWQPAVNPLLAVVVSLLTASYYWITARKILEAEQARPVHDLGELIGATGEAKTEVFDDGSVYVAGELWSATSKNRIPRGARVRVVKREGLVLEVEPI